MPQKGSKWFTGHYKVEKKKKKRKQNGSVVRNLPANAKYVGFDPWVRKIPSVGNGNPLWYSCLGNLTDRGAWWVTVHGVAKELDMTSRQAVTKTRIELKEKEDKFHLDFPLSLTFEIHLLYWRLHEFETFLAIYDLFSRKFIGKNPISVKFRPLSQHGLGCNFLPCPLDIIAWCI